MSYSEVSTQVRYFPGFIELDGLHRGEFWQLYFNRQPCIHEKQSTRQLRFLSGKGSQTRSPKKA